MKWLGIALLMAFFSIPTAKAAYDCSVAYPGSDSISPFTYDACCYPNGGDTEPYQGIACRPEGQILMLNPTRCVDYTTILGVATSTRNLNRAGFNCQNGSVSSNCRSGYCMDKTTTCILRTGVACPLVLNRSDICPGGCGACNAGFVYCVANRPAPLLDDLAPLVGTTPACVAMKDGSTWVPNGGKTCADMGREVANPCTGECSACPAGKTLSGRTPGLCVEFGIRFIEIFADGFTNLGGNPLTFGGLTNVQSYAYGSIGKDPSTWLAPNNAGFFGKIFTEVDQADHLNWSSPTVPNPLQELIANNNYLFCDASYACPAPMICTAGFCNNPTGTGAAGQNCTTSSACNLGLDCVSGKCVNPDAGLTACTSNAGCTAPQTCVLGYCHNQNNGNGAACPTGLSNECAAGLICNANKICTVPDGAFAGLTGSTYDGNQTNYSTANNLCNASFRGSHVCSSIEIIKSNIANTPTLAGVTDIAWVNSAAPGNITPAISDCGGWTKNVNPYYGTVWNFTKQTAAIQPCFATKKFACCQ